jgi:hypothetical protein
MPVLQLKTRTHKKNRKQRGAGASQSKSRVSASATRPSSHSHASASASASASANNNMEMPSGFRRLQNNVKRQNFMKQFPDAPKLIPNFQIKVKLESIHSLSVLFINETRNTEFQNLVKIYSLLHSKSLSLEQIYRNLLHANKILKIKAEQLQNKFLDEKTGSNNAVKIGGWYTYIKNIIDTNYENIGELTPLLITRMESQS